jgi:hypothetical protein
MHALTMIAVVALALTGMTLPAQAQGAPGAALSEESESPPPPLPPARFELPRVRFDHEERARPPLSAGRVGGEALAGLSAGAVTGALGVFIGPRLGDGGGYFPGDMVFAAAGCALAYPLGVGLGVSLVGHAGDQTGSTGATIAGAYMGALVGTVAGVSVGLALEGDSSVYATLAGFLAGAPIGGVIGFNTTRDYDLPHGTGLVNVYGGDARLSIPAIAITPDPLHTQRALTSLRLLDGRF